MTHTAKRKTTGQRPNITMLSRINAAWDSKSGKTDWSGLEGTIRLALSCYHQGILLSDEALEGIDEALAAFTKRGRELS